MKYKFWGKVRRGKARGKSLGFPTANIALHKPISEGIYISKTRIYGVWMASVTFIGKAKTFHETVYQSETYILHYNKQIYGIWITNLLLKKIRGNQAFKSPTDLVRQIKADVKMTRKYFKE